MLSLLAEPARPRAVREHPLAPWFAVASYIPANNAAIMALMPLRRAATAGGMVNMTRGLGTAAGVTAVTLALHLGHAGAHARHAGAGVTLAMLVLAAFALAAVAAALAGRPASPGGERYPGHEGNQRAGGGALQ